MTITTVNYKKFIEKEYSTKDGTFLNRKINSNTSINQSISSINLPEIKMHTI